MRMLNDKLRDCAIFCNVYPILEYIAGVDNLVTNPPSVNIMTCLLLYIRQAGVFVQCPY